MLMVATARECHRREMTSEEQKLFGIDKLKVSRSSVPAVTHVDYSARVQTVHLLLLLFRAVPPKQRRMMVCNCEFSSWR